MQTLWIEMACVALAGAAGSLLRWGLSTATQRALGSGWPTGTLVVNALGCLVFGLAMAWCRAYPDQSHWPRLIWLTGFAGAFTTFSTLVFDLHQLHVDRGPGWALANLGLHLALGGAGLAAGLVLGRSL